GRGVEAVLDRADPVGREAALPGVLAHDLLVGRHVHAVDPVLGHEALDPLNLRPQLLEHRARLLRQRLQVLRGHLARAWNFPFDDVPRHAFLLRSGTVLVSARKNGPRAHGEAASIAQRMSRYSITRRAYRGSSGPGV